MDTTGVYSSEADDPDLVEMIELFVDEMPDRIATIESHARNRDWLKLAQAAHQLKGAAGSYGFDILTPYAEKLLTEANEAKQEDRILAAIDDLAKLCRRMRSGVPNTESEGKPNPR
jgi:HPt (histidine-containing phosphotransfer) domain-containing protein